MAEINRQIFLTDGALAAMKHLADEPVVIARLLELAATAGTGERLVERRTRALQVLEGKVGNEHLEVLLEMALDGENPASVRDHAFDRVGDIRSPAAIPAMWGMVQDSQEGRVRWRAGELVLAIGGPEVLSEFFNQLPRGSKVEYAPEELEGYATRMGQMKPLPRSVATGLLRSSRWWERVVALRFFARKGETDDIPVLEALVRDRASVAGSGWPDGHTVGKVAEAAVAGLRQRLEEGQAASEDGSAD
jgi:hypothetical protein